MKRLFIFIFGLVLFLQSAVGGNLLPALDTDGKWNSTGKVTLTSGTADGKAAIKAEVSGGEGGFWCRDIALQQGSYRLKFSYRTIRAGLRVIVKHGDNTYSALDKAFPVSREWKQAEVTFTESKPGAHASVWFLTAGAIEIANLTLTQKLSEAEATLQILTPTPATAPAELPALPDLSQKIVLMQEYHMWFRVYE
jgi:hypothetical protein